MVLDHADPAGQHADFQDTVESPRHSAVETILDGRPMEGIACPELLEHSLKLLDTTLDGGLVGGNSCSTSGRVVGPHAGPRQWTRETFA